MAAAFVIVGHACVKSDAAPALAVGSVVSVTGDTIVMRLSHSPTVASLAMPSEPAAPDVVERLALPAEVREAHIADVEALPNGRVALLLRDLRQVVVLRDGAIEHRFGRRGEGPGEFRSPLAVEASDSGFAVLDRDAIELFRFDGTSVGRARLPWLPDWSLQLFKKPNLFHRAPFQSGPEDVSRRFAGFGADFVVLGGERGISALPPQAGGTEHLSLSVLRLSSRTLAADSVESVRGPERSLAMIMVTDARGQPMTNIQQPVNEPLFGARPLVAGTSTWFAIFDPARDRVSIVGLAGDGRRIVTWPHTEVALTDSLRVQAQEWLMRDLIAAAVTEADARQWERNARRATFAQKLRASQSSAMSEKLASVAAMFAAGRCLWLVGTDLRDFTDGTGHWGIAVSIETGEARGPFRLAKRGSDLRDIGFGFAYFTSRTSAGEFIVERTPLPLCAE
ncbi:MAG: hypothetical protein KF689_12925 [Gemmatimonadaceae bacterium]|nr:hypothetical protein [Gemmatimonadaceae bacterium]MCW5827113.1 hypothetical protein [Gemmatimonadaceae bacterium]